MADINNVNQTIDDTGITDPVDPLDPNGSGNQPDPNITKRSVGGFPLRSEANSYYERPASIEKEKEIETAPKMAAPKPKILTQEGLKEDLDSLPKSSGRVVDQRSTVSKDTPAPLESQDPITIYADKEEDRFIKGVKTEHDSLKP